VGALFDTNVGPELWPLLPFSFIFCCLAVAFYGCSSNAGKMSSEPENLLFSMPGSGCLAKHSEHSSPVLL